MQTRDRASCLSILNENKLSRARAQKKENEKKDELRMNEKEKKKERKDGSKQHAWDWKKNQAVTFLQTSCQKEKKIG